MNDDMRADRRAFLWTGATAGAAMMATASPGMAQTAANSAPVTRGDIAILRFLAAAEIIESDLWVQYNELGGATAHALTAQGLFIGQTREFHQLLLELAYDADAARRGSVS